MIPLRERDDYTIIAKNKKQKRWNFAFRAFVFNTRGRRRTAEVSYFEVSHHMRLSGGGGEEGHEQQQHAEHIRRALFVLLLGLFFLIPGILAYR